MKDILLYFSCKYQGNWFEVYKAVMNLEKYDEVKCKEYKKKITSNYITILDESYPERLKRSICPPYVIFYKGNIKLLDEKKIIAVIGSRENSSYGEKMTKKLVIDLVNNGYSIISGLAKGIDAIAHSTCLENNGKTIAVIGSGFNYTYPKENYKLYKEIIKNGLIVSEYPDFVKPQAFHYPSRNRIIAGIGDSILVTEAKVKSGTMITVKYGLDCGKDIFAVPSEACLNSGCNRLIKEGAQLVETIDDLK